MHYRKPILAVITLLITGLFACDSNEIGESKDVNQDRIYMDYDISFAEGDESVSLNFQFRFAGSAGTTLVLNNPCQVELDGVKLKVDSSKGGGAFYQITKDYTRFSGKHNITFTNFNGKRFENSFEFAPTALTDLPANVDRSKDLVITFNTAAPGPKDYLAVSSLDTDSSFYYHQAGPAISVTIPASALKRQKSNEIQFESTVYREIPLQQTTSEGGLLKFTYRLKPAIIKLQP
jgi:hypothetical protein